MTGPSLPMDCHQGFNVWVAVLGLVTLVVSAACGADPQGSTPTAPSGVSSAQVKSSVSLTKVECAVCISVLTTGVSTARQHSAL